MYRSFIDAEQPKQAPKPCLHKASVRRSRRFWMVISQTNPVVTSAQLPIYWLKKVAQAEADKHGGKVVAVDCCWTPIAF